MKGAVADISMKHFRYRNFRDRFSQPYASSENSKLKDKGASKRVMLDMWRREFFEARDDILTKNFSRVEASSELLPFSSLVKMSLLRRFRLDEWSSSQADLKNLPARLLTQLADSRAYAQRVKLVIMGQGRSGTTMISNAAFNLLPSFLYMYEPCRQDANSGKVSSDYMGRRNLVRDRKCSVLVDKIFQCALTFAEFQRLRSDKAAWRASKFLAEMEQEVSGYASGAYFFWMRACQSRHVAIKDIRFSQGVSSFVDVGDPLTSSSPRVLMIVRDPANIVKSRLGLDSFSETGTEWNPLGSITGVIYQVCHQMNNHLQDSAASTLLRYEDFLQDPHAHVSKLYSWLGFSASVPSSVRAFLKKCVLRDTSSGDKGRLVRHIDEDSVTWEELGALAVNLTVDYRDDDGVAMTNGRFGSCGALNHMDRMMHRAPSILGDPAATILREHAVCRQVVHSYNYSLPPVEVETVYPEYTMDHEVDGHNAKENGELLIGRIGDCSAAPLGQSVGTYLDWERSRRDGQRTDSDAHIDADPEDPHVFEKAQDLYTLDSCWVPRVVCSLTLEGGDATPPLQIARSKGSISLLSGKYIVILGPAAAIGAQAKVSFAATLEEYLGMPVVNLGRGGASPATYIGAGFTSIESLLANAHSLIVVVMAGRSSPNSHYGSGATLHEREREGNKDNHLVGESLRRARADYIKLFELVRSANARNGNNENLNTALLYMSSRPLLTEKWQQRDDMHPRLMTEFPDWISGSWLAETASVARVDVIDATFPKEPAHPALRPLLRNDQCTSVSCSPIEGDKICTVNEARLDLCTRIEQGHSIELNRTLDAQGCASLLSQNRENSHVCPRSCKFVLNKYYPPQDAHDIAADAIIDYMVAKTTNLDLNASSYYGYNHDLGAPSVPRKASFKIKDLEGTWKIMPRPSSLYVTSLDGEVWWSNSAKDIRQQSCLYDYKYTFHSKSNKFTINMNGRAWLEPWQSAVPWRCGNPVEPHVGKNKSYSFSFSESGGKRFLELHGRGAFIGMAKATNQGELSSLHDPVPHQRLYVIDKVLTSASGQRSLLLSINTDKTIWFMKLTHQTHPGQ